MLRILALVISVVFQPLLIPSLMVVTLFYIVPEATVVPHAAKCSILLLIILQILLLIA